MGVGILTELEREKGNKKSRSFLLLIIALIFLMLAAFAAAAFLAYRQQNNERLNNLIRQSEQTVKQTSQSISKSAEKLEESLSVIGENSDLKKLLDRDNAEAIENVYKVFENYRETHPEVQGIYIGTEDKKMYVDPKFELPADYEPTSRSWYINALNKKGLAWSEPYADISAGTSIITLSLPVYSDNKLIGVLSADLNLNLIVEEIKDIKLGENGYAIITDQKGTVVMYSDKPPAGQPVPVEALRDLTAVGDSGLMEYIHQKENHLAVYSKIDKLNLNLIWMMRKN